MCGNDDVVTATYIYINLRSVTHMYMGGPGVALMSNSDASHCSTRVMLRNSECQLSGCMTAFHQNVGFSARPPPH